MADISSYAHKFRATGDAFQENGTIKVSKRNRQPLSCLPCRNRKLKCDRGRPCETCVKRNNESSCRYGRAAQPGNHGTGSYPDKAQDRLRKLEQLVLQMVDSNDDSGWKHQQDSLAPTDASVDSNDNARDGRLEHGHEGPKYVGSTHWSVILENIQELKDVIGDDPVKTEEVEERDSTDQNLLFGSKGSLSMQNVLDQYLPPRVQVDRRLSTYFNAKYVAFPYIHTSQFQRQYEQFWKDPLCVSPLWISILFSICSISAKLNPAIGSETSSPADQKAATGSFLTAAAQCLVLGDYTRPKPFVVEALCIYAVCKYMGTRDPSLEVGIIFSILIRLAYRMGYHRDPDHFPHFCVFEGEMRRRIWAMCKQFDLMVSFQLGLPSNVVLDSGDTKPPRNLLDSDFDEHTVQLPPSRPEHEPTPILYFVVKSRLMTNFGKVCNHVLSFNDSQQAEAMALDAQIRQTYSTVPEPLHIRPMSQSFADPSYLIMVRLNCEFLYQKSLCVLHRKYMIQGFECSTSACIDAARAIVKCFSDIYKEFQLGGQLYSDRWMLSSFTMNDFLLATMILCFAVSMWRRRNPGKRIDDDDAARQQLDMLVVCSDICRGCAPMTTESQKVAEALQTVLSQIRSERQTQRSSTTISSVTDIPPALLSSMSSSASPSIPQSYGVNLMPVTSDEIQASIKTSRAQASLASPGNAGLDDHMILASSLDMFEPFFDSTEAIDWTFSDQYLVNPDGYAVNMNVPQNSSMVDMSALTNLQHEEGQSLDPTSTPMHFLGTNSATNRFDFSETLSAVNTINGGHLSTV